MKLNFNNVAKEICKREESESREVNITDVKRVMRHFFDILADEDAVWLKEQQDAPEDDVDIYPPGLGWVEKTLQRRVYERLKARKSRKRPDKKGR